MAVATAVDVANIALSRLGQGTISTLTESSRDASICNALYESNRDYCLMVADWDCLVHMLALDRAGKSAISGATQASPVSVTCATHTFVANELVTIEDVVGMTDINDGVFRVGSASTSVTIHLYDTDGTAVDGTGYTSYSSGGYVYRYQTANWSYVYDLPDGCLKVLKVLDEEGGEDDGYLWHKERTHLYCDVENAMVRYVKKETDPSKYEPDLLEVMVARLAWYISMRIHADEALRNAMYGEMQAALARARLTNADGANSAEEPDDLWSEVW